MNFDNALKFLRLLPTRPDHALTVTEILARWNDRYPGKELVRRSVERYVNDLSYNEDHTKAVLGIARHSNPKTYFLQLSEVANWLMTEEAALYQVLSLQVLQSTFGESVLKDVDNHIDAANLLTEQEIRSRNLRKKIRIVPDGIGRLRAHVDEQTLQRVMDALAYSQRLTFDYTTIEGKSSTKKVCPLGLVAKDGALYLIAVKGFSDEPKHYALHRIKSASLEPVKASEREGFNLDAYIEEQHYFSHRIGEDDKPIVLKLRVSNKTIFHFRERPLSNNQRIEGAEDGAWLVYNTIPLTHMLKPFLASLGPGVEVLEPLNLREDLGQWLMNAAAHYR